MNVLTFVAAAIVLATIVARGADHPTRARDPGLIPTLRLHAEKIALLLVGATAGSVMLSIAAGLDVPAQLAFLLAGTALWMLTHPAGWWRFVVHGRDDGCQQARPDP